MTVLLLPFQFGFLLFLFLSNWHGYDCQYYVEWGENGNPSLLPDLRGSWRSETMKPLEENIGSKLFDIDLHDDFLSLKYAKERQQKKKQIWTSGTTSNEKPS